MVTNSTKHFLARLGCLLGVLSGLLSTAAFGQTGRSPYYSTFNSPARNSEYAFSTVGLLTLVSVTNPDRAADMSLTNYATLEVTGLANHATLRLRLNGANTSTGAYRAGVVVSGNNSGLGLNANLLNATTLTTYSGGTARQTMGAGSSLVSATALSDGRTRLEFIATSAFDHLEVDMYGLLAVANTLNVFYAYAVPATQATTATGVVSRFTNANSTNYTTSSSGAVCLNTGVQNPLNAVSKSLTDYATMRVTGVGCQTTLGVSLEQGAPAGYRAGFVLGSNSLLDLTALQSLKLKTYKDGVLQETASAASLLSVNLLPDGKYQVSFNTTKAFDRVELEKSGLVGLLDDLNVYYGFGLEPRTFQDQNPVLSNFPADQTSGNYVAAGASALCVNCALQNPQRAADNVLTDYAEMQFPVNAVGTQRLRVRLNGTPQAGNLAGMVLSTNTGLLSTSLLENVTLRTYAADGITMLESASGASLLNTGLLDGRQQISFPTTQAFSWVEVQVTGGVNLFSNARIAYGFAEDPIYGFPSTIIPAQPLPVQLTAFRAQAGETGVTLNWETASELNSRYFDVERSADKEKQFVAVGRVEAAGTTSAGRSYMLLDASVREQPAGTYYYRLHQVDEDGTSTYSQVQAVTWSRQGQVALSLYPNPATDEARVQLLGIPMKDGLQVQLYDLQGKLVRRQGVVRSEEQLSLHGLRAGLYQVVVRDAAGHQLATQRLAVQSR